MIDRGCLILANTSSGYRGTSRPSFDAHPRRALPEMRELVARYRAAVLDGEGVLEDLDEATAIVAAARDLGCDEVELVVFEVPQVTPATSLPLAAEPPAPGLTLLGWDVIELIEPYHSALRDTQISLQRNASGLIDRRADAEALARALNAVGVDDELHAARIWVEGQG